MAFLKSNVFRRRPRIKEGNLAPLKPTRSFLEVFPREIRDLIYTFIFSSSSSGTVALSPWNFEVTKSMTILRICKQVQRECKEIIWQHNSLRLREQTQLFTKFSTLVDHPSISQIRHIEIWLELLDRDELEWVLSGLQPLSKLSKPGSLQSISLVAINDRPRNIKEFEEELDLVSSGEEVDGRFWRGGREEQGTKLIYKTCWPRFSGWGKQSWYREMLLDRSDTTILLGQLQDMFCGKLFIDSVPFSMNALHGVLNPRNGEIKIVLG
ncbi:hypothetical protein BGZ60DRAFT_422650 [Tricladium varicosporioides]|nr:hypothetical protein BGZ60DRAFT_422650 [Hymenoscyphus varicosporioides]